VARLLHLPHLRPVQVQSFHVLVQLYRDGW
jgi:hypothetical protein